MGCECSTTRNDVTLIEDETMVAYATVESRCEPAPLEAPPPMPQSDNGVTPGHSGVA